MLTVGYARLDVRAGHRLLDLGCGFGRHTFEALKREADVVACDLARAELITVRDTAGVMVAQAEVSGANLAGVMQADGTRLPFDDDTFDRVIASEVLEHMTDDRAACAELARVLRPGGRLAVTVPTWLPEKICWMLSSNYHAPAAVGGHVRIYRKRHIRRRLAEAGLEPGRSHHAHALHSPYWWLRCAVGPDRDIDENRSVRAYHRLLEWDIVKRPRITRAVERMLNPVLGKSLVVYAAKPVPKLVGFSDAIAEAGPDA